MGFLNLLVNLSYEHFHVRLRWEIVLVVAHQIRFHIGTLLRKLELWIVTVSKKLLTVLDPIATIGAKTGRMARTE